jgi:ribosomal-protein-alanine N-acetyltransferase
MHIREAVIGDLDDLMHIEEGSFQEERFSKNLVELFIEEDEFDTLVCEIGGTSVGYAAAFTEPEVRTRVLSLAVDQPHRKKGIARRLMQEIEHRAKGKGSKLMTLEVRVTNVPAVTLYLEEEYLIKGTIEDYYGAGEDAFYMEKKL